MWFHLRKWTKFLVRQFHTEVTEEAKATEHHREGIDSSPVTSVMTGKA